MIKDTHYAKYIFETEGLSSIENEIGFVFYKIIGNECFLAEMFTQPEVRGKGLGRALLKELSAIAIAAGCKVITANIRVKHSGISNTLGAALKCGFKVLAAEGGVLLIGKELEAKS